MLQFPNIARKTAFGIVIAGLFTLASCASAPTAPARELQAAELAITRAEQARVADYASIELSQARTRLQAARAAVIEDDMVLAQRLADESRVNAELAFARAEMLKAKAINDEMQKGINTLKQEMSRQSGAQI